MREKKNCTTVNTGGSHLESIRWGLWDFVRIENKDKFQLGAGNYNF